MLGLLKLLARPLIEAAVSAFGKAIIDLVGAYWAHEDAKAVGRAEAERAAIIAGEQAMDRMEDVMVLSDEEIIRRLREGEA